MAPNPIVNFGPISPEPLYNAEIASMLDTLFDIMDNLASSPSATEDNVRSEDLKITQQNWKSFVYDFNAFKAKPHPYAPNADNKPVNEKARDAITQPGNTTLNAWINHMALIYVQMRNGVSRKQQAGLNPDEVAISLQPMVDKMDAYLEVEVQRQADGIRVYTPDTNNQLRAEAEQGDPDPDNAVEIANTDISPQ